MGQAAARWTEDPTGMNSSVSLPIAAWMAEWAWGPQIGQGGHHVLPVLQARVLECHSKWGVIWATSTMMLVQVSCVANWYKVTSREISLVCRVCCLASVGLVWPSIIWLKHVVWVVVSWLCSPIWKPQGQMRWVQSRMVSVVQDLPSMLLWNSINVQYWVGGLQGGLRVGDAVLLCTCL